MCLAELADCVDPFTFFIISEQESLDGGISGILGMALGAQTYNPSGQPEVIAGPILMNFLKAAGVATSKIFSLNLLGENSFIHFGPSKVEHIRDSE